MQNRPINNNEPRIQTADINQTNNTNQAATGVQAVSNTEECPATSKSAIYTAAVFAAMLTIGLGLALYFALSMPIIPITVGVLALAAIVVLTGLVIARSLSGYCSAQEPDPSSTQEPAPTPIPLTVIPRATIQPSAGSHTNHGYDDFSDSSDYSDDIDFSDDSSSGDDTASRPGSVQPPRLPIIQQPLPPSDKSQFPYDPSAGASRISVPYPGRKKTTHLDPRGPDKTRPTYIPMPYLEDGNYATIRRSPQPPERRLTTFQGPAKDKSSSLRRTPINVPSPKPPAGGIALAKVTPGTLVRTKSNLKEQDRAKGKYGDWLKRQQSTSATAPKPGPARDQGEELAIPPRPKGPAPKLIFSGARHSDLTIPPPPTGAPPPPPSSHPSAKAPQGKHPAPPPTAPKPRLTQEQLDALRIPPPPTGAPPPPPRGARMPVDPNAPEGATNPMMEELKSRFHRPK